MMGMAICRYPGESRGPGLQAVSPLALGPGLRRGDDWGWHEQSQAPFGPIPPEFAGRDALPWLDVATPAYVYDFGVVAARVARFRAALPEQVALHYAIKANPFAPLLAAIAPLVDGLDVASAGEMGRALDVMAADAISFAGPGKRNEELDAAIRAGVTINLESIAEGQRALAIGKAIGVRPRLAVRVNPDFELRGSGMKMGGRASPFGIESAHVPGLIELILGEGAEWRGLHIFAGSQSLDTQAIVATQAATIDLAARLADACGVTPPLVNLGGGFGIPYFAGDLPVDVEAIGAALAGALGKLDTADMRSSWGAGLSARRESIWRRSSIARRARARPS
jgi:diaminopimelate decarboxylase